MAQPHYDLIGLGQGLVEAHAHGLLAKHRDASTQIVKLVVLEPVFH